MRVELSREGWYLCDWADQPDGEYREFRGNQDLALHWLRQFRSNFLAMNVLRMLCARESMIRLGDDEVLGQVSWWLSSGRVKARRPVIRGTAGGGTSEQKPVEEVQPAFPLEFSRRSSGSPATPWATPDPPLFPGDADAEAIAEGQKAAALLGVPFCEECLRKALRGG